ncbi:MAG: B12-binding domain-containing radical SAM protein [Magnetococcales bacterium]|nr:B12-binding domain-containing radical SAM protein [Magnetococcales bacterium]
MSDTSADSRSPRPLRVTLYDYSYETFAIQYLAAILLERGFDCRIYYDMSMDMDYLDQDFFLTRAFSLTPEQAAAAILDTTPDVVGFSLITPFYPKLRRIIAALKKRSPETIVVVGGPHATLAARQTVANEDIDFVFVGEADTSLPNFLTDLIQGVTPEEMRGFELSRMPGVWNRTPNGPMERGYGPFQFSLDSVPFPEKKFHFARNSAWKRLYSITCSRGCVFSCTYCNSSTLRKKYKEECGANYFRVRSVDNVMSELKMAKERYKPRQIMFLDNLFAPQIPWLREFAPRYRQEIGLPFFCETNPMSHTKESLALLAEAGCTLLQFGFQSANERVRREILGRRETNARIKELVVEAKRLGMFVCVDHIANLPGEIREHLDEAVSLYQEIRPNWVNLGFLQLYPEADIVEIAISRKMLKEGDLPAIYNGTEQTSFRLVSKSKLGDYYRTLPIRFFAAFRLSPALSNRINGWLENLRVARILSTLASPFIYASRILVAFTDRRDFLVRHHILRNLLVMVGMAQEKWRYRHHG